MPWPAFAVDIFPLPHTAHGCEPPAGQRTSQGKGFLTEPPATSLGHAIGGLMLHTHSQSFPGTQPEDSSLPEQALFQVHLLCIVGTVLLY